MWLNDKSDTYFCSGKYKLIFGKTEIWSNNDLEKLIIRINESESEFGCIKIRAVVDSMV